MLRVILIMSELTKTFNFDLIQTAWLLALFDQLTLFECFHAFITRDALELSLVHVNLLLVKVQSVGNIRNWRELLVDTSNVTELNTSRSTQSLDRLRWIVICQQTHLDVFFCVEQLQCSIIDHRVANSIRFEDFSSSKDEINLNKIRSTFWLEFT